MAVYIRMPDCSHPNSPAPGLTAMDEPFPDVHELFRLYSAIYFSQPTGCLDRCMVEWSSKRMTLCAGALWTARFLTLTTSASSRTMLART